jgi:hypothetical protein
LALGTIFYVDSGRNIELGKVQKVYAVVKAVQQ